HRIWIMITLTPVLYFLAGGFFWIFVMSSLVLGLIYENGFRKFFPVISITGASAITLLLFKNFIFLEPYTNLTIYPLPVIENSRYKILFFTLVVCIIFYPLIIKITTLSILQKKKYTTASLALSGIIM